MLHVGLGAAQTVSRVEIYWPVTRQTQTVTGLPLDRISRITEQIPPETR